jgi:pimeloyl-ACP methyl ester carboxylesterase
MDVVGDLRPRHPWSCVMSRIESPVSARAILARADGATIAYCRESGPNPPGHFLPGIVFCGGFRSDMTGIKATTLAAHCRARGRPYLRFDYFGHGASSGDFRAGTIGRWRADALAVLDELTEGPQILIGSSMGGWIALLAALARPARVAALIGIAPAPDFTEELVWNRLGEGERRALLADGGLVYGSAYEPEPVVITRELVEEGRRHLLLGGSIALACPVRLLHGMRDPDVPYGTSLRLAERLAGTEVTVELVEDGDHRLSRPTDLDRLLRIVDEVSDRLRPQARS